jgi:hypothetical protein
MSDLHARTIQARMKASRLKERHDHIKFLKDGPPPAPVVVVDTPLSLAAGKHAAVSARTKRTQRALSPTYRPPPTCPFPVGR